MARKLETRYLTVRKTGGSGWLLPLNISWHTCHIQLVRCSYGFRRWRYPSAGDNAGIVYDWCKQLGWVEVRHFNHMVITKQAAQ